MTDIHYFPRYSQPENFATNNTLLLLLRLNQYNRFKFERFMEKLCADQDFQLSGSWLQFSQQRGTGKSVLDGYISQDSLKIAVETKRGDGFDLDQLERHLGVFGTEQHKLLILLSPTLRNDSILKDIGLKADKQSIQVSYKSFEEIIRIMRECLSDHDEEMTALVNDYESFCSEWGLLPRDRYTMFVPTCGASFQDNLDFALYYCPVQYSRRKAKYLGVYSNRSVRAVGEIVKIVPCNINLTSNEVVTADDQKLTASEKERIIAATRKAPVHDYDVTVGHKFFLCERMTTTEFRKITPGPLRGFCYFDLEKELGGKVPDNTEELASALRTHTWQ
ncbi:MAG TPA: hypothetical protein VHV29_06845 [Terriglobales bacterium]|jgi:hypothetical protein|nr:hypothetical protein [Terriglobales bacterium]